MRPLFTRWLAVVALALACRAAPAFINPRFTPVHLLEQSDTVIVGRLEPAADAASWRLRAGERLEGPGTADLAFGLAAGDESRRDDLRRVFAHNGAAPVLFFASGSAAERRGLLHVGGNWIDAAPGEADAWVLRGVNLKMGGTFAGGTDMLIRMLRYLQSHPGASVPVTVGTAWSAGCRLGTVDGEVGGLAAVTLAPGDPCSLFVASPAGDRLFRPEAGADRFVDVTAAVGLDTRSRRFAWVDMDRDGAADLVSWNGKTVVVRRVEDGRLRPAEAGAALALADASMGIDVAGTGTNGSIRLVISTPGAPLVACFGGDKAPWTIRPLPLPASAVAADGCRCVVADLDGDGYGDVLQPRAAGGLLWRGGAGGFGQPEPSAVTARNGGACQALGDFNTDGIPDLFLSDAKACQLWENDGRAGFRGVIDQAGSLGYKAPGSVADCTVADLNHDGRPDLLLGYADGDIVYHFNRGFRCMGEEGELRLGELAEFAGGVGGVRACAVADFNGDGADDLAVAMVDGSLWCLFNERIAMPGIVPRLEKGMVGPVTVSVWQGKTAPVCMGTRILPDDAPGRFWGLPAPGPYALKWRFPGHAEAGAIVIADETVPAVVLGPDGVVTPSAP